MKQTLRRLVTVLATGMTLFLFSELVFWARYQPGVNSIGDWLVTWLAYCWLAAAFLYAAAGARAHAWPALFLCGALYGWLGEAVLVQTAYEYFPLQISWTGLAWHALISVLFGWVVVRRRLMHSRPLAVWQVTIPAGLAWGAWAIFWWVEQPVSRVGPLAFAGFAFGTTAVLAASYAAAFRWGAPAFPPGWWAPRLIAGVFGLIFVITVLPQHGLKALVLLALVGLTLAALRRNRWIEQGDPLTEQLAAPIHLASFVGLLGLPLGASLVYSLAWSFDLNLATNLVFLWITAPAGAVLWIVSVIRLLRAPGRGAARQTALDASDPR